MLNIEIIWHQLNNKPQWKRWWKKWKHTPIYTYFFFVKIAKLRLTLKGITFILLCVLYGSKLHKDGTVLTCISTTSSSAELPKCVGFTRYQQAISS